MLIIEKYKERYFTNDLFNPEKYIEISEEDFNNQVIKYRNLFKMKYEGDTRVFTNITNEYNKYKIIREG